MDMDVPQGNKKYDVKKENGSVQELSNSLIIPPKTLTKHLIRIKSPQYTRENIKPIQIELTGYGVKKPTKPLEFMKDLNKDGEK